MSGQIHDPPHTCMEVGMLWSCLYRPQEFAGPGRLWFLLLSSGSLQLVLQSNRKAACASPCSAWCLQAASVHEPDIRAGFGASSWTWHLDPWEMGVRTRKHLSCLASHVKACKREVPALPMPRLGELSASRTLSSQRSRVVICAPICCFAPASTSMAGAPVHQGSSAVGSHSPCALCDSCIQL